MLFKSMLLKNSLACPIEKVHFTFYNTIVKDIPIEYPFGRVQFIIKNENFLGNFIRLDYKFQELMFYVAF